MSTTAPSTPENTPRKVALNRSFTLPAKVATSSRTNPTAEIGAAEGIETLYVHPNCKVIKFTSASRPGSSGGTPSPSGSSSNGKLPWATLTEQTLAAGPLEIYRVPGSVSFLHSGALLHAILPRSNCWCVDGVSKFAMRVLPDTYYRIELPGDTPEDLEKIEECKQTLKKVLHYERTPCPFARTFTVDLPEELEVKKTRRRRSHGAARKWKLDRAYSWKPEDGVEPQSRVSEESSGSAAGSDEEEGSSSNEDTRSEASESRDAVNELPIQTPSRPSVKERARGFNLRSVTAPAKVSLPAPSTPTPRLSTRIPVDARLQSRDRSRSPMQQEAEEPSSGQTSLRPFQSIPTDMPPSPPDSSAGIDFTTEHPPRTAFPDASTSVDVHEASFISDSSARDTDMSANSATALKKDCVEEAAKHVAGRSEGSLPEAGQLDSTAFAVQNSEAEDGTPNSILIASAASQEEDIFVTYSSREGVNPERGNHESLHDSSALESGSVGDQSALLSSHAGRREGEPENGPDPAAGDELSRCHEEENSAISEADNDVENDAGQEQLRPVSIPGQEPAVEPAVKPDPYAQIQARIQARRSIGGTTSFHPTRKSPTRQSTSSTASSASLSSMRSGLSRRSGSSQPQQQALASALVRKACAVFLGPPAHLVVIMLRIAARFAKGALPSSLMFESPAGMTKRVPGSFDLEGSDVEDFDLDDMDWEEDDFGVPLRSPIRLAMNDAVSRELGENSLLRERKAWDG
ncbi:hypothetical protein M409DRAFT_48746 [Zasmidium cellare ATCC 36951]|uniref:Inheritance of peroxisomes protein 1 n=1 Tax=Zasmidium cellare ATCC 36951 TaxID=1080233 RepID=A0A6A6D347_ZASCE|nr:uncharacterized protein M409DRAFT_48746 [Zasmidium cellare ATCC 36951]KAF2173824.1 hypothetical protein M409DRAFT_48746 [Zasmidium cellare ATCC 36951]